MIINLDGTVIAFDLDGTLVDLILLNEKGKIGLEEFLELEGLITLERRFKEEGISSFLHPKINAVIRTCMNEEDFWELFNKYRRKCPLYEDAKRLVRFFEENSIPLIVITNSPLNKIYNGQFNIPFTPDILISCHPVHGGVVVKKPLFSCNYSLFNYNCSLQYKPDTSSFYLLKKILEDEFNITIDTFIYVGDFPSDVRYVQALKNEGINAISVLINRHNFYEYMDGVKVVNSLDEFIYFLKEIGISSKVNIKVI